MVACKATLEVFLFTIVNKAFGSTKFFDTFFGFIYLTVITEKLLDIIVAPQGQYVAFTELVLVFG